MSEMSRYRMIDCIKGVACLAVVLIHYNFAGDFGLAVKAVMRFAVPCFFFVSGFFMADGENVIYRSRTWRKLKHILHLLVFASAVYAIFTIVWNNLTLGNWEVSNYIQEKVNLARCVKLLLSCDPFVYAHLWFLLALLFCYVIFMCVDNYKVSNHLWFVSIPLLIGFFILAEFNGNLGIRNSIQLFDTECNLMLFNMPVFRALPFFLIGMLIKKNAADIAEKLQIFPKKIFMFLIILGACLAIYERLFIKDSQYYVGNMLMFAAIVSITLLYKNNGNKVLEYIGNKLSLYVYIFHIAVGKMIDLCGSKFQITKESWYLPVRTLGVLIGSLMVAYIVSVISEYLKNLSCSRRIK